jgi:hypothetical protein
MLIVNEGPLLAQSGPSEKRSSLLNASKRHHGTLPIETVDERVEVGVAAPRRAGDLPATKRLDSPAVSRLRLRTSLRDEPPGSHILVVIAGWVGMPK